MVVTTRRTRHWRVAGALVEQDGLLLLVANRRPLQPSVPTPGGVVDPGETTMEALGREVREETGLIVDDWSSVVYEVSVDFPDRDMVLDVEVYLAESWHGEMVFDDPDGIVEDGRFVSTEEGRALLASAPTWVDEPVGTWLAGGVGSGGRFEYLVRGTDPGGLTVERR